MSNPDTVLEAQNFVQVSAPFVQVTPTGGVQANLGDILAALDAGSPSVSANGIPTANIRIPLTDGITATGVFMSATPSSTNFGISFTPGTSLSLVTNAANSSTVTNSVFYEITLPPTYVSGSNFSIIVDGNYNLGSGTLGTNTLTVTAYNVSTTGAIGANVVTSAAKALPAAAADQSFAVNGATLVAGARLLIELVVVVQSTTAANITSQINSIRLQ